MSTKNSRKTSRDAQELGAIFETALDCLIIIDATGMITKINPAGAKLFGYEQEELIGQKINVLMPKPHREEHDRYLQKYEKTGNRKVIGIGRDVTGIRKDGTSFTCNLSVSEFFIEKERFFAGVIHDLTNRKESEQKIIELNQQLAEKVELTSNDLSATVNKLLKSNRLLEQEILERKKIENVLRENESEIRNALEKEKELNDLKSRFVAMASHEFRTPLSTILSSTSLIERYVENGQVDKANKHFSRIKSSVKNLTEILNDFLSLSKIEEGKVETSPEELPLLNFCHSLVEDMEGLLKEEQTIEMTLPKEEVFIYLDKNFLRHILINLFSNAIKYSGNGKKIFFVVQPEKTQLYFHIQDQGIGIPKNEQKHLFSRFFRGSNAINIKGTGLGLNIVQQYLSMMNGDIHFESIENQGTKFAVRIPLEL